MAAGEQSGLAEIEDAASDLAVYQNGGFGVGALPFCFGLKLPPPQPEKRRPFEAQDKQAAALLRQP